MRAKEFIIEGGGYIPQTEEEARDPRFMMAITCDIHPGEDVKQAAKFNFNLKRGGIPPLLKSNGNISESKDKFTKKTDFRFNKGAMLMQRVGPINAQKQNIIIRKPPVNRGMWAFPYPAFDMFFAHHKIEPLLPSNLRSKNITALYDKAKAEGQENDEKFREAYQHLWDLREKASKKLKNKMRPKTFWWDGPIYSHIAPKGMQDDCKSWYLWTDLKAWAKEANKNMVTFDAFAAFDIKPNIAEKGFPTYGVDELELFLPEKAEITKQKKGR